MTEGLEVAIRQGRGTRRARGERRAGRVPAVLYGHGQPNVCLSIPVEQIEAALRHGSHLVQLQGEVRESALIKEVQWDTYGSEVLHVDLMRVQAGESVEVTLAVQLRGEAPGVHEGGTVQHMVHEVEIQCPASLIPEKLELKINSLGLGQSLTAADLELPAGAALLSDPDLVIVQCVAAAAEAAPEEEVLPAGTAEPEVIGRKAEEGEEEAEDKA